MGSEQKVSRMEKPTTILENLIHTTVRIETLDASNNVGSGTGFILAYKNGEKTSHFIVTNKHIVEDAQKGFFLFNKLKDGAPDYGNQVRIEVPTFQNAFFGHQDPNVDISVFPFSPLLNDFFTKTGTLLYFKSFQKEHIWDRQKAAQMFDAIEDVLIIGYPNGIYEQEKLLPIVRKGITATPINIDFNRKPAFLIDASIFPGSSGSPVIVFKSSGHQGKGKVSFETPILSLVGVVSAAFYRDDINTIFQKPIPTTMANIVRTQQMIDIGYVEKAHTIIEAIDTFSSNMEIAQKVIKSIPN